METQENVNQEVNHQEKDYRLFKREDLKFPFCGIEQKDLGENNITRLENGRKTDVFTFKFNDQHAESGFREVTGRASLYRKDDSLHVKITEKREELFVAPAIMDQLTDKEKDRLLNDKISTEYRWVYKDKLQTEGGKTIDKVYIFPDIQTNTLVFVDAGKIRLGTIRGNELSEKQQTALMNGATLDLILTATNSDKKYQGQVRLDPSAMVKDMDSSFVQIKVAERKQKEEVTQELAEQKENVVASTNVKSDGESFKEVSSDIAAEKAETARQEAKKEAEPAEDAPRTFRIK